VDVAFYGHPEAERFVSDGIPLEPAMGGCEHICLGWSPELSANFGPVLVVNTEGLDIEWDLGEGRTHEPIPAEHVLGILTPQPKANWEGWEDPALRINHSACLQRLVA
jgi:hypothetical protein